MPNIPPKVGLGDTPKIISERVLLVEGNDDYNFFQALLRYMKIQDTQVQIHMLKGKDNYRTEVPALLNDPGFFHVSTYAFIRDADKDALGAFVVCSSAQIVILSNVR